MNHEKPVLNIQPSIQEFLLLRSNEPVTVICGSNNTGKSFLLRNINVLIGLKSNFLASQRFFNFEMLNTRIKTDNEVYQRHQNMVHQLFAANQNQENNSIDLGSMVAGLSDDNRSRLLSITSDLIGTEFNIEPIDANNTMGGHYVKVDGHNLSFTSSGTRVLMTLVASLLSTEYDVLLIDEPELGLNPKIQKLLSEYIYDPIKRSEYFPHLKNIYIGTHSHIFLDRNNLGNNFYLERKKNEISITQTKTISEFNKIQFGLLGNTFESLFLPSIFVIVEGKTDFKFIRKVFSTLFPKINITLMEGNGDGGVSHCVNQLETVLGNFAKSPYKDRIFIVLDETHAGTIVETAKRKGISESNIVTWSKNGIEFYYPIKYMMESFNCPETVLENINITEFDSIEINGISKTKNNLCDEIVLKIDNKAEYNKEFTEKLIDKIRLFI